jgi:CRISPR/Cas system CSM-associated protein Csm2 small subunit
MRINDPETGQPAVAKHAPIIDEYTFYLAQAKLNKEKVTYVQKNEHMFLKGILFSQAGRLMTSSNPKGKNKTHWYYVCPETRKNYNAERLHAQFFNILDTVSFTKEDIEKIRSLTINAIDKEIADVIKKRTQLTKQETELQKKIRTIEEKYLSTPEISKETYDSLVNDTRLQLAQIQAELARFGNGRDAFIKQLDAMLSSIGSLKDYFPAMDFERKKKVVNFLFGGVLLYADGCYRTPKINPILNDKILVLKEKGLLQVQQSLVNFEEIPLSSRDGEVIAHLLSAIA